MTSLEALHSALGLSSVGTTAAELCVGSMSCSRIVRGGLRLLASGRTGRRNGAPCSWESDRVLKYLRAHRHPRPPPPLARACVALLRTRICHRAGSPSLQPFEDRLSGAATPLGFRLRPRMLRAAARVPGLGPRASLVSAACASGAWRAKGSKSVLSEGLSPKTGQGGNGFVALTPPAESSVAGPPRDLEGYAWQYPDPKWPSGAKLAINLVVNFEEGSEASFHHGDNITEASPHHTGGVPRIAHL